MNTVIYTRKISRYFRGDVIEDLESGNLSYAIVREFLLDSKEEFRRRGNKIIKMAELKKVKQEGKTMEEFV